MEYILRLKNILSEEEKNIVRVYGEIVYSSKYIPIAAVKTSMPSAALSLIPFVEHVRLSRIGVYQEGDYSSVIAFMPPIQKRILVNNQMTGFGSEIFILDSGVNCNEVNIQEQKDFTRTGRNDFIGHGTIIAKIVRHLARGSHIYSAKIGTPEPNETNLMLGIEWAIDKGADIINISSEFNEDIHCKGTCELCELVNFAAKQNISVVVAAGNSGQIVDSIVCPGRAMHSLTVGAVNSEKTGIASYSSIGKPGGNKPNMLAPGEGYLDGCNFRGTSFAAPIVVGILGALHTKIDDISECHELIYRSIEDLGLPSNYQGLGCLNLERLVEVLSDEASNSAGKRQIQN
jgi:serine protease AprX